MKKLWLLVPLAFALAGCPEHTADRLELSLAPASPTAQSSVGRGRELHAAVTPRPAPAPLRAR